MCSKGAQQGERFVTDQTYKSGMKVVHATCPFCRKKNTVAFYDAVDDGGKITFLNGDLCEDYHGISEHHIVFKQQEVSQPPALFLDEKGIFDE